MPGEVEVATPSVVSPRTPSRTPLRSTTWSLPSLLANDLGVDVSQVTKESMAPRRIPAALAVSLFLVVLLPWTEHSAVGLSNESSLLGPPVGNRSGVDGSESPLCACGLWVRWRARFVSFYVECGAAAVDCCSLTYLFILQCCRRLLVQWARAKQSRPTYKLALQVCLLWYWDDIRGQLGWFICFFCMCGLWLLWRI